MKIERALAKYLVNPVILAMLLAGVAPRAFALLETSGRRTGKRRRAPVGNGLDGDVCWLVSEHGERCAYVRNLIAEPRHRRTARPRAGGEAMAQRARVAHHRRRRQRPPPRARPPQRSRRPCGRGDL